MESIIPTVVFTIFGLPITSTVVATWCAMILIIVIIFLLSRILPDALEMIVDMLTGIISTVLQVENVEIFLPLLGTLAIFIAVANILGIFPVLTAPTSDINTTIALSLSVFLGVHVYGIKEKGFKLYFKQLATPVIMLPFEVIGQISRSVSLAVRLFGNIISGELITAIVFSIVPLIAPLPFAGLGLFFGILQAYVFTALSGSYIDQAVAFDEN